MGKVGPWPSPSARAAPATFVRPTLLVRSAERLVRWPQLRHARRIRPRSRALRWSSVKSRPSRRWHLPWPALRPRRPSARVLARSLRSTRPRRPCTARRRRSTLARDRPPSRPRLRSSPRLPNRTGVAPEPTTRPGWEPSMAPHPFCRIRTPPSRSRSRSRLPKRRRSSRARRERRSEDLRLDLTPTQAIPSFVSRWSTKSFASLRLHLTASW